MFLYPFGYMTMFAALLLLLGGIFGCYGIIVATAPSIRDELDAIAPFQTFVGVLLVLMGLYDLFFIGRIITLLESVPFYGMLATISLLTKLLLGSSLCFSLVEKYLITPTDENQVRAEQIAGVLIAVQIPLGVIALLLGVYGLRIYIF